MSIMQLNENMLHTIALHLPLTAIGRLCTVNRAFKQIFENSKVWTHLFIQRVGLSEGKAIDKTFCRTSLLFQKKISVMVASNDFSDVVSGCAILGRPAKSFTFKLSPEGLGFNNTLEDILRIIFQREICNNLVADSDIDKIIGDFEVLTAGDGFFDVLKLKTTIRECLSQHEHANYKNEEIHAKFVNITIYVGELKEA